MPILTSCPECFAAVLEDKVTEHADWHSGCDSQFESVKENIFRLYREG